jgi:mono/diheme cytochrome c family protein
LLIAGAAVVFMGLYPVGASQRDPAGIAWLLEESMEHAVKASAKGLEAPRFSQADIREGGSHFKGMCQGCHGGPGAEPEEFASGMNPHPPNLARAAGDLSVPEVFWIAKHGIKMSGMPAFGKTDEDEELWKVAAFVKALPAFSAEDYASIPNAHQEEQVHAHMAGYKQAHSH